MNEKEEKIELVEAVEVKNSEDVIVSIGGEQQIEVGKNKIIASAAETKEALKAIAQPYLETEVKTIKDLAGYNYVIEGRKKFKKYSTAVEKKRKELTAPALKFQKELKAVADDLQDNYLKNVITHLDNQIKSFEDAEKAEKERVFRERVKELTENGFQLTNGMYISGTTILKPEQIEAFKDSEQEFYIVIGKKEVERAKAETDRKANEAKELKELKDQLKAQSEQMAKQQSEMDKKQSEMDAQQLALDARYAEENKVEEVTEEKAKPEGHIIPEDESSTLPEKGDKNETHFKSEKLSDKNRPELSDVVRIEGRANRWKANTEEVTETRKTEEKTSEITTEELTQAAFENGLNTGFNDLRDQLIKEMDGGQPRNRAGWLSWAKKAELTK